jgi:hypothetical protein
MSLSRRQRRDIAKRLGYLGKSSSIDDMRDRFKRSNEMGKHFHLMHLENIKNSQIESDRAKELEREDELIASLRADSTESTNSDSFNFLKIDDSIPESSDQMEDNLNG